jgi:hypothetical protein
MKHSWSPSGPWLIGLLSPMVGLSCGGGGSGGDEGPGPIELPAVAQGPNLGRSELFQDVAGRVGLILDHDLGRSACPIDFGSGAGWGDYDGDGDLDLMVTNLGGANRLYRNEGDLDGDGLPDFSEVAGSLGIAEAAKRSYSAVFIDYDNDGDQDLFVTHNGSNTFWQNRLVPDGAVAFVDVTTASGLQQVSLGITTAWADFDGDGFLDVYMAHYPRCLTDMTSFPSDSLFHSRGDGTFEDWTGYLCNGLPPEACDPINGKGVTAGWFDLDNDGDLDLYVVNDLTFGPGGNFHFRNDGPDGAGGWLFTEISRSVGTFSRVNGMGLAVGDLDNDGWMDLSFTNIEDSVLLRNRGDGTFEDLTVFSGVYDASVDVVGWGTCFFDADHDGWVDLFTANGPIYGPAPQANTFLRNRGNMRFENLSEESGLANPQKGRNATLVDFDDDGYVDLFVGNLGQAPNLYHNRIRALSGRGLFQAPAWLKVTVEGTDSNRDGIGTRLTLRTAAGLLVRDISSGPTHGGGDERAAFFGLGRNGGGRLGVRWPNGIEQDLGFVAANQRLHLVEPRR